MFGTSFKRINKSNGAEITNLAIASGLSITTEAIPIDKNVGFSTILLKENKAGAAGSVSCYPEWSIDGTNFYRANTTSAGTLTQEGDIVSAVANETKWICFTPRVAMFVHFIITATATDSQVTLDAIYQEQF